MEVKIGKFFESVADFITGTDQIPWCDRDIVAVSVLREIVMNLVNNSHGVVEAQMVKRNPQPLEFILYLEEEALLLQLWDWLLADLLQLWHEGN
ncbi:hypothetical protein JCGZ_08387 [Jatropha curcas]|uniref:Uncharacterized protein n=1 Tax=Jatropha curcas TaxID=180498 RepID=A0A067KIP4_JATCU|nr:hypothetical protein JCGZ_08387 [Jatropha curcas]